MTSFEDGVNQLTSLPSSLVTLKLINQSVKLAFEFHSRFILFSFARQLVCVLTSAACARVQRVEVTLTSIPLVFIACMLGQNP